MKKWIYAIIGTFIVMVLIELILVSLRLQLNGIMMYLKAGIYIGTARFIYNSFRYEQDIDKSKENYSKRIIKRRRLLFYYFATLILIYVFSFAYNTRREKDIEVKLELERLGITSPKTNVTYKTITFSYPNLWNLQIDSALNLVDCGANGYGYSIGFYNYEFPIDKVINDIKFRIECNLISKDDKLKVSESKMTTFKGINAVKIDYEMTGHNSVSSELITFYANNKTYYLYRYAPLKTELLKITNMIDSTLIIR